MSNSKFYWLRLIKSAAHSVEFHLENKKKNNNRKENYNAQHLAL